MEEIGSGVVQRRKCDGRWSRREGIYVRVGNRDWRGSGGEVEVEVSGRKRDGCQ